MGADNIIECSFGLEAKVARSLGIGPLGPAGNDSLDQLIGHSAYARGHFVARNPAKRFNLFAHRAGYAGHRKVDARTDLLAHEPGGMDEKSDRRARASMRVAYILGDRKKRLLACERLPDDPGEKTRSGLVRLARPHANRRQSDADPVEETAPR